MKMKNEIALNHVRKTGENNRVVRTRPLSLAEKPKHLKTCFTVSFRAV